jgi:hypothetical protein
MADTFKYDIAFSFLSTDEKAAQEINDSLQDRYRTFIYPERQKELAGTDGEEAFKRVFAKEARTVAVLFRPEWGTTRWTRIEETAIRDRAHDDGYDFCTFIAMAESVARPNWLPKNRLQYVAKRFGLHGAAAVLEARLQEQGGTVHEETVVERGQRLKRVADFAAEAEQYNYAEGVGAAKAAFASLLAGLARHAEELTKSTKMHFLTRDMRLGTHLVASPNAVLVLGWHQPHSNVLTDSKLNVRFYDKMPNTPSYEEARELESTKFDFKLVGPSRPAWVHGKTEVAPDDMADYLMNRLMHHNERELRRRAEQR